MTIYHKLYLNFASSIINIRVVFRI